MRIKNKPPRTGALIFIVFGLIFMTVWVTVYIGNLNFIRTAVPTTALITDVQNVAGNLNVYVRFSVDGIEYEGRLPGSGRIGMRVNQHITIYHNPDNPQDFRIDEENAFATLMLPIGMSAVFVYIGYRILFGRRKQRAKKAHLTTYGKKVMATFERVERGNITVNGRNCRNIICRYIDETTGTAYLFESDNIWVDPPELGGREIPPVPVYLDVNDYSKHYVAVDEFFAAIAAGNNRVDWN